VSYEHCPKHDEDATNGCVSCLKEAQAACEHTWKCMKCELVDAVIENTYPPEGKACVEYDRRAAHQAVETVLSKTEFTMAERHRAADELLALYLRDNERALPSQTSVLDLMTWVSGKLERMKGAS